MQGDHELHVQTDERESTGRAASADPSPAQRLGEGIARGAAVVASLTIVSRIVDLVRTLLFSQAGGAAAAGGGQAAIITAPEPIRCKLGGSCGWLP
jgi:hypothetical protein